MVSIHISSDMWCAQSDVTRVSFEIYLINAIFPSFKTYDEIERTIIRMPTNVTKIQRYNIHKLSKYPDFKAKSFDDNNDERYMEIILSKSYVQQLFQNIPFPAPVAEIEPVPVPKTERQIIFDNLIDFIQLNFENEFKDFLDTAF